MIAKSVLVLACGLLAGCLSHEIGIAPILGAILCAYFFLKPKELFFVGLGGILVRDLLIGFSPFTVVRLVGMTLVVESLLLLKLKPNVRSILTGLLVSSPVFHVTLAVGDWWTGTCTLFPKTAQGLAFTIGSAFPYFLRSFTGDLLFTSFFLSLYLFAAYHFLGWRLATSSRRAG